MTRAVARALVLATSFVVAREAVADGQRAVVRVATMDPVLLSTLLERLEGWACRQPLGELLVVADDGDLRWLAGLGLAAVADPVATAELRLSQRLSASGVPGIPGYPCYRTVTETHAALAALAAARPTLASWVDFGDSWELVNAASGGSDLFALRITNQQSTATKAPMVVIAAMHARELTTAEVATRFAERLVLGWGVDPDVTWILDHVEVTVVPQLNPDGRMRAEAGQAWRKNADDHHCGGSDLRGVDLNRNSSWLWGNHGGSGNACSEVYRGPAVASEPETAAIEALLAQLLPDQRGGPVGEAAPEAAEGVFLSLHSAGGFVLYPWEGTEAPAISTPPLAGNAVALRTLGRKLGWLTGYDVCQTCLSATSGTTVDVAYGEYGVAAYTLEIGNQFFEPCATFEDELVDDLLAALLYAAKVARRPYLAPAGPEVVDLGVSCLGSICSLTGTADDTRSGDAGAPGDAASAIASTQLTVDDPPWVVGPGVPLAAADGSFDAPVEAITGTVDLAALGPGRHLLFVTATDAEGSTGAPTAIFVGDPAELFRDGFESGDMSAWTASTPP